MFNKVLEEKVLDYILTMFSMLDGRWLACERVSSFYHLLLFCLYLILFALFIVHTFVVLLCFAGGCDCLLFVLRPPATSQRCSVFFSFIYRLYVQVFLGMKIKIKMGGGVLWEKNFWESEKTFGLQLSQSKSFFKTKKR